ncbi:MAG: hypothetical protein Q8Q09_05300 [Deltaproteobacteria bacterium]|nr:hypothetical protein [Deltaproteobacteria bacterium]
MTPQTSGAQPATTSHIEASVRLGQARAALRRGQPDEALRYLRESLAIQESTEGLREIARIYEAQGQRRLAAQALLRLSVTSNNRDERAAAGAQAAMLQRASSLLRVWVVGRDAARRARVWIDHAPPRTVQVGGLESLVEGGSHRVRVESPGYLPYEAMIATAFGEPRDVQVRMVRDESVLSVTVDAGLSDR